MQRLALAAAFAFWMFTNVAYSFGSQDENLSSSGSGPARTGVSIQELQALKPIVLSDLMHELTVNGRRPTQRYVQAQFNRCEFRKMSLGKLGNAVLMEFHDPDGGPNSGEYAIYVRRNGSYSRVAQGGGFGPYVLAGIDGIPDLAFGSTMGACHETFVRLRYSGTTYKPDACVHNDTDANGDNCHPEACDDSRKLPMFPEPDPSAMQ